MADIVKYFEATLAGWTVVRLTERQLKSPIIERIVEFVNARTCETGSGSGIVSGSTTS